MTKQTAGTDPGALSTRLWVGIEDIYAAILEHPFVRGVADGSLPREAFRYYVVQDAHYLRGFARALSVAAARAPGEEDILMFTRHAAEAIEVERSLHEGFFRDFGLSEVEAQATPMAPTNVAYVSYLLAVAYGGSFPEALGAVLPCYWIYWEVGKALERQGSPNALYQRWIDTYAAEEFAAVVHQVLALLDRIAPELSEPDRLRVAEHFRTTSRYEWMFWDMGWRQERWPI